MMRTNEELLEKHGENRYPASPLRVCPNCFLVDYHQRPGYGSKCRKCGWTSDLEFHRAGSDAAMVQIIAEIRGAIDTCPSATQRRIALNALAIVTDDWEWKK